MAALGPPLTFRGQPAAIYPVLECARILLSPMLGIRRLGGRIVCLSCLLGPSRGGRLRLSSDADCETADRSVNPDTC